VNIRDFWRIDGDTVECAKLVRSGPIDDFTVEEVAADLYAHADRTRPEGHVARAESLTFVVGYESVSSRLVRAFNDHGATVDVRPFEATVTAAGTMIYRSSIWDTIPIENVDPDTFDDVASAYWASGMPLDVWMRQIEDGTLEGTVDEWEALVRRESVLCWSLIDGRHLLAPAFSPSAALHHALVTYGLVPPEFPFAAAQA
jgi:hypothetical protein